jgi:hypothetical protein
MKPIAVGLMTLALLLICFGSEQAKSEVPAVLCGSGCDYLVKDFSGTYPDERERVNWECYDRESTVSIACTFVRGNDIRKYSDVYRKRNSLTQGSDQINQAACAVLRQAWSSASKAAGQAFSASLQSDESDSGCEMVDDVVEILKLRREEFNAFKAYKIAGCTSMDYTLENNNLLRAKRRVERYKNDCEQASRALNEEHRAETADQADMPGLTASGTITRFGGSAPTSPSVQGPDVGPAGRPSGLTGRQFGDHAPLGGSGSVRPAR